MTITRTARFALKFSNPGKQQALSGFVAEYIRVANLIIDLLWKDSIFTGSYVSKDILSQVETWLSERAKQAAGKQALQVVKLQRKRKRKTKPTIQSQTVELDSRFVQFLDLDDSSFDEFVKFSSLGNRVIVVCPIKHHRHYNDLISKGFRRSNSTRLAVCNGNLYLDVILERDFIPKATKKTIGIDVGIKKLMVDSDGNQYGKDIEDLLDKISRKKQKSKAFDRALRERDAYINKAVKQLPDAHYVLEALTGLRKNTVRRQRKEFRSKSQRWTYAQLLRRIELHAEVVGVQCQQVSPSYTSQACSKCGFVHKSNRVNELFKCGNCGYTLDADFNASLNILNRCKTRADIVPESAKTHVQLEDV